MIFRMIDDTGDWTFGRGTQSYTKDLQALMLDLKTRILSWVGDCFFDLGAGIDWKNLLDYGMRTRLTNAIKILAFKTAGVIKVNDITIEVDSVRSADITLSVDTIYGSNIQNVINFSTGGA